MLKKIFSVLTIVVLFGVSVPLTTGFAHNNDGVSIETADNIHVDKNMAEKAKKLSEHFAVDENGDIEFTADKETLEQMGISESDAELMIEASTDLNNSIQQTEGEYQTNGFIGIKIIFGPKVRNMSSWAGGLYVGGYVAFQLKHIAGTGIGAGLLAVISGAAGSATKWALDASLRQVNLGFNHSINLSYTIRTP